MTTDRTEAGIVSICWSARVPCHVSAVRPHQHAPTAARPKHPEAGSNYPADFTCSHPGPSKPPNPWSTETCLYHLAYRGSIWQTAAQSKVPTTGMDIAMPAKCARSESVNSSTGKLLTSKPCRAKHCDPVRQTPERGTYRCSHVVVKHGTNPSERIATRETDCEESKMVSGVMMFLAADNASNFARMLGFDAMRTGTRRSKDEAMSQ